MQDPPINYPLAEEGAWDGSTPLSTEKSQIKTNSKHWLSSVITDKNNIKKAIVLNELFGKPRGLQPY